MSASEILHPGLNVGGSDPGTHEKAGEGVFGFWVFLMSDAVVFALLFATYGVMLRGTAGGPRPRDIYDLKSALIETALLLVSSFTFGMASLAMKYRHRNHLLSRWLVLTLLLGLTFIGFELHDFWTMFLKHATPERSGYLSSFFVLVSTHGLHVFAGSIWILAIIAQLKVYGLDSRVKINVMRLGLFWHFLDIVWVVIFTVVYLQGLSR